MRILKHVEFVNHVELDHPEVANVVSLLLIRLCFGLVWVLLAGALPDSHLRWIESDKETAIRVKGRQLDWSDSFFAICFRQANESCHFNHLLLPSWAGPHFEACVIFLFELSEIDISKVSANREIHSVLIDGACRELFTFS